MAEFGAETAPDQVDAGRFAEWFGSQWAQVDPRTGLTCVPVPLRFPPPATTQLYALLDDKVADAEIRAARRRRDRSAR